MSATECSVHGCAGAVKAKGLCNAHYLRLRRYGDPLAVPPPEGSGVMPKCCATKQLSVAIAESELRRLARIAARRPTDTWVNAVIAAKDEVRARRSTFDDHLNVCVARANGGDSA